MKGRERALRDPSTTLRSAQDDKDERAAGPEFISREQLIKATAMLTETGEEAVARRFEDLARANDGEPFGTLADFLAATFLGL